MGTAVFTPFYLLSQGLNLQPCLFEIVHACLQSRPLSCNFYDKSSLFLRSNPGPHDVDHEVVVLDQPVSHWLIYEMGRKTEYHSFLLHKNPPPKNHCKMIIANLAISIEPRR